MPFLIYKPKGYSAQPLVTFFETINLIIMKRFIHIVVSLYFEYRIPKLVKVKAYKRIRRGKVDNGFLSDLRLWGALRRSPPEGPFRLQLYQECGRPLE